MGFKPDRINAFLRTLAAGEFVEAFNDTFFLKIDGDRTAGFRHRQSFGKPVDRNDLLGTEQHRAADRHLSDGAAAPNRDGVGGLDVALHGALPSSWENVRQEQQLLVGNSAGYLDVRGIRKGNAQIFRLATGITAGEVSV